MDCKNWLSDSFANNDMAFYEADLYRIIVTIFIKHWNKHQNTKILLHQSMYSDLKRCALKQDVCQYPAAFFQRPICVNIYT